MIAARTTQFWRSRHRSRRPAAFFAALVVYIIVILVAAPQAQQPQAFVSERMPSPVIRDASSGSDINLLVGRSTVLNVGSTIARVSLTVPDIADALVTAPSQILIHGKQPGTISLFVWDRGGSIKTYEVNVTRDLTPLKEHIARLFPGEEITVLGSGKDVVLSGTVSGQYVVDKAADVAAGYVEKKDNVVNLLKQQEGVASNQVMLRVRFAEVSRSALQELGASFFANGYKNEWFGRTAPPGVPSPEFDNGELVFSDFLNIFVFNSQEGLGGVVRALQTKGLFQSLAEPNLIATNGKEASFLAGGEYPYPVIQPTNAGTSVTIMFKEFGIRLNFTPTVLGGDLVHLKVRPEVSALDFANAITLEGFRIPALSTRRTETEVELRDGQTFAIAGLMNNTLTNSMSKIPGIGDIPILGLLFRSKAHQKNQTELVVMITPTIIRKGQMGVSEGLPALVEPYLGRPGRTYPNPDPYTGSPRYPANQAAPRGSNAPVPAPVAASDPVVPARTLAQPSLSSPMPPPPSMMPAPGSMKRPLETAPPPSKRDAASPVQASPRPQSATQPMPPPPDGSPVPVMMPGPVPVQGQQGPGMPATSGAAVPPRPPMPAGSPTAMPAAPMPPMPAASSPRTPSPVPVQTQPAMLTPDQIKAIEKAREQERKAAEGKQESADDKDTKKKAAAEKRQADRLAKERARREAEIAKKNAEEAKKKAADDEKREKALAEAAARLKEAQAAYQAEIEKAKGGGNDRSKQSGKGLPPSGSGL
ncbi:MAG TPA: pilus assembly protein N-terminal domain-containing protein [Vicinamibacterales bacterium]|nr:pilus assembly protein N-terminal domain-containing protein [Vicinamibacterales bacterium]